MKSWISFGGHYYLAGFFIVILLAIVLNRHFGRFRPRFEAELKKFLGGDTKPVLFLFFFSFGLYAAVSVLLLFPYPKVHDEFCYLLTADIFLHGRLSMEAHPLGKHFETFFVIQNPFYVSKYPPAQGAVLAVGGLLGLAPIFGVWISCSLAVLGVYWLLRGLFSIEWAFYGGVITVVHPILFSWSQNYWGGAAAFLGGALVFGGAVRLLKNEIRVSDSILLSFGIAVLANSRPYEGFLLTLAAALAAGIAIVRNRPALSVLGRRLLVPAILILLVNFCWMAFYNQRTTGNFRQMPYTLHHAQYHSFPLFLFQKPRPRREITEPDLLAYEEMSLRDYEEQVENLTSLAESLIGRLSVIAAVFFTGSPVYLAAFILGLWQARKDSLTRVLLICFAVFVVGLFLSTYSFAHYAAPALGLAILFILTGIKSVWNANRLPDYLKTLILLIPVANLVGIFLLSTKLTLQPGHDPGRERHQLIERLKASGGKHLIVVPKNHQSFMDARFFIYNEAVIDDSPIVWSRDVGEEENRKLLEYYGDRHAWRLTKVGETATLMIIRRAAD